MDEMNNNMPVQQPVYSQPNVQPVYSQPTALQDSYFDGGLLQYIGWKLLGGLITLCTLGICLPWAYCMVYNWEIKHTVIGGKRLSFDGKAVQLFGSWIKWFLLTLITVGIYGLWVPIKLKKWKVKHTYFVN